MKISNFKEENIINKIGEGIESEVYLYNDNGNIVVFKKFFKNNTNKEIKLIILKNEEVLKNDIKILNRMYYMGKFIGFTSVYEPYEPVSSFDKKKDKLIVLKALQEKYEELNKRNIYIGDFNSNNFCMANKGIKLYDIDNYRIDNLDFNEYSLSMKKYFSKCSKIENIDFYCYNYYVLKYLSNYQLESILTGTAIPYFPKYLRTKEILNFINYLDNINDYTVIEKNKDGKQKTLLNLIK